MIKNYVHLEHKVEDRVYTFICHEKATLGELHDALHAMKATVLQRINEVMASEKPVQENNGEQVHTEQPPEVVD